MMEHLADFNKVTLSTSTNFDGIFFKLKMR